MGVAEYVQPQQDAALGVAVNMGLLEHIVAKGEESMNASELSEKTGGAAVLIGMM